MKQIEAWIDWSKTFLIFAMVLGHLNVHDNIMQIIYAFHMPAFFIISGYLYRPKNWKDTCTSLIVPVLLFSLFNLLYKLFQNLIIFHRLLSVSSIIEYLSSFIFEGSTLFPGLWFIEVLLVCRLIMGDAMFMRERSDRFYKYLFLICFIYMVVETSFTYKTIMSSIWIYRCVSCLPFMITGMYFRRIKNSTLFTKPNYYVIYTIVFFIITFLNQRVDIWSYRFGYNYILAYLSSINGFLVLYSICKQLPCSKYSRVFSKGTLLILGIHIIIISICNTFDNKFIHLTDSIKPYLYLMIIAITSYFCINAAIQKYPILLGKKR